MATRFVGMLFALLLLALPHAAAAQEAAIVTGRITNPQGQPEPSVLVRIEALNVGTTSQADGAYRLIIPHARLGGSAAVQLSASRQGLGTVTRALQLRPGQTVTLDVVMVPVAIVLENVVVQGTAGATEVTKLPFTVSHVTAEDLSATGAGTPLVGKVAGAAVTPAAARAASQPQLNTEEYSAIVENRFHAASRDPLSTFAIDVDRASYSNVRRFIGDGAAPPRDAVRIEEMVNYFTYAYPDPTGEHPFAVTSEVGAAPWNPRHQLVRIGLQGRRMPTENLPASNLVFLVDVSGSMQSPDKLPLVKASLRLLVNELSGRDRIALVVYAGAAGLVLDATPGDRKTVILDAIDRLEAGGSTAGAAGIQLAYDVARRNHMEGGNNRVILATDGDFNVGVSDQGGLVQLIEQKRVEGTFLTVLGFGTGNLADARMEQLADKGNGNYAYVDDLAEARKVLVTEMGGTLFTLAKDVKLQVEFNPAQVHAYRLIGYENRLLASEDFNDDRKDAGEMGAGHSVTALYEVVLVGADSDVDVGVVDSLRYQRPASVPVRQFRGEMLNVRVRYKTPDGERSRLLAHPVRAPHPGVRTSDDFRFAAAVAAFGMVLRDSEHRGGADLTRVLTLARGALGADAEGYRADFVRLVQDYRVLRTGGDAVAQR